MVGQFIQKKEEEKHIEEDEAANDEDFPKEIYSNPLFDEEIIPMKIDPHHYNAESNLIESLPNHDSSIIYSSKIDSLFDEFAGELTLLKSVPLGIDETDCHPEEETHFITRSLYDNSSPRPPKEFVSKNSDVEIESFSPSPIPVKDSDSLMEEIDLSFTPNYPMPPGIEEDDYDSERDILIFEVLIPAYYDDDEDDYTIVITPKEPDNSLSMGDEHLDTISATESGEFINDDQLFYDEDIPKEIYSNPLFDEEIISMTIDTHHFNAESDLIESLLNHDSSIISSSSKIDSLFDEFAGELTLLKSISPRINETDCDPEKETCFIMRLLYDNSSPRLPEEFISENSDAAFESFSPSPIPGDAHISTLTQTVSSLTGTIDNL
nr:hypothetical protein [Tanacetum cinerariifolium]